MIKCFFLNLESLFYRTKSQLHTISRFLKDAFQKRSISVSHSHVTP